MLYDAHTHLNSDELYPSRQTHVSEFFDAGGQGLVTIGVDADRNMRALTIAHTREQQPPASSACWIKTAVGYHPSEASRGHITDTNDIHTHIALLEDLIISHKHLIVAIGECGTDLHYPISAQQYTIQKELFFAQCTLARKHNLPVVVHSRDDFQGTREIIQQFPQVCFYLHCRGYTPTEVEIILSHPREVYIGFCGNLTYPKAQALRESLLQLVSSTSQAIPHQLLLETDAPYLIPQQRRGQKNTPKYIDALYAYVAEYLRVSRDDLESTIQNNIYTCYHIGT